MIEIRTFDDVVSAYEARWIRDVDQETSWFGLRPRNLTEAIERACLSQIPSGKGAGTKRHSHQTRLSREVLVETKQHVLARSDDLSACATFDELFNIVEATVLPIRGAGEMLVYDVAQRIGIYLKIKPKAVYLHRGTRKGAKALGLRTNRKTIEIGELPAPLQRLSASQLEDVLCLYSKDFQTLMDGRTSHSNRNRC